MEHNVLRRNAVTFSQLAHGNKNDKTEHAPLLYCFFKVYPCCLNVKLIYSLFTI